MKKDSHKIINWHFGECGQNTTNIIQPQLLQNNETTTPQYASYCHRLTKNLFSG